MVPISIRYLASNLEWGVGIRFSVNICAMQKTFDLHIAANHIPAGLFQKLLDSGYREQLVIGGDDRVKMQYLLSINVTNRNEADDLFARSVGMISKHPSFRGYIEEEVIVFDTDLRGSSAQLGTTDCTLERVITSQCPPDIFKRCDIHLTVPESDLETLDALRTVGFYHLQLDKPEFGRANIITLQFEDIGEGKKACRKLMQLVKHHSVLGSLKFEVTINIKNFGFEMPPIVLRRGTRLGESHSLQT